MAARRRGKKSDAEKLRKLRKRFEQAVDHNDHARSEAHRAGRFYHNTRGQGQWETEDRDALLAEGRPCYAFNICREKVDSFLGIYGDAQRTPMVTPSGGDDEMIAEAVDAVTQQVFEDAGFERKKAAALKGGTIYGSNSLQVEFRPDDKNPRWVQVFIHRISLFEINWDPASIEPDRSDAGFFFWDRWMARDEFERWYPDDAKDFDLLTNMAGAHPSGDGHYDADDHSEPMHDQGKHDDYDRNAYNRYYFDRQKGKARVIRYEFKTKIQQSYSVDRETGEFYPITAKERKALERASRAAGIDVEVITVTQERVKVCEFIGTRILAEYDSAGPFDGFSVSTYTYAIDEEEGTAYGALRNLFDPQMELNKANSLLIEAIANGSAPGVIAEEGAIPDEQAFKSERRTVNGVAIVQDGALTAGQVTERDPYPLSPAVVARAEMSVNLIDRISGMPSQGMVTPASQAEAATTVALRHHKARQIVADPIANYEWMVSDTARKVVEGIIRAMPDDQFEKILGRDGSFRVESGMLLELGPHPQDPTGQTQTVVRQAELRRMADLNWSVEMELQSDNTTIRMLEQDTLSKLQAAGVPVDPEVLVEGATSSRSKRERLKKYVEQVMAQQSQAAQAQAGQAEQTMALMAANERAKVEETARANRAKEALQALKQQSDREISLLEVWEKADAAEKQAFMSMLAMAERERAAHPVPPSSGTGL